MSKLFFTGATGEVAMPEQLAAFGYELDSSRMADSSICPYGKIELETFTEGVHIRVNLPGGGTLDIPQFRLRHLRGEMVPVYCESRGVFSFFSMEEPSAKPVQEPSTKRRYFL